MRRLILPAAPIAGAGLALLLVSCAGMQPFTPPPPDWIHCVVQETPAETTATIGPGGGSLPPLPRGHTLEVPAGAVPQNTQVTFRFRQTPNHRAEVSVQTTPANVVLAVPAVLTISTVGRQCAVVDSPPLAIYRQGQNGAPADRLPTPPTTPPAGRVAGEVLSFSLFAIAQ